MADRHGTGRFPCDTTCATAPCSLLLTLAGLVASSPHSSSVCYRLNSSRHERWLACVHATMILIRKRPPALAPPSPSAPEPHGSLACGLAGRVGWLQGLLQSTGMYEYKKYAHRQPPRSSNQRDRIERTLSDQGVAVRASRAGKPGGAGMAGLIDRSTRLYQVMLGLQVLPRPLGTCTYLPTAYLPTYQQPRRARLFWGGLHYFFSAQARGGEKRAGGKPD